MGRAQLVDEAVQGLLRREVEQLVERAVGFLDAQVFVEHQESLLHGLDDGMRVLLRFLKLLQAPPELVDVHDHDDRAVDPILESPVGPDTQRIPSSVAVLDRRFARAEILDHVQKQRVQVRDLDVGLDVRDPAADVALDQVQHLLAGGREPPDSKIEPHDDDGKVDTGEHVDQVVGELGKLLDARLKLLVHGPELLVAGLELLLRGFQLLVRALKLLVAREDLLVGRLQLLLGSLMFRDRRLKVLVRAVQLTPEERGLFASRGSGGPGSRRRLRRRPGRAGGVLEHDEEETLCGGVHRRGERRDLEVDGPRLAVVEIAHALSPHGAPVLGGLADQGPQFQRELLAGHLEKVEARLTGRRFEIWTCVAPELEDLHLFGDDRARGRIAIQEDAVGLPLCIGDGGIAVRRSAGTGLRAREISR